MADEARGTFSPPVELGGMQGLGSLVERPASSSAGPARSETVEHINLLREAAGGDAASVHDQPPLVGSRPTSGYSKTLQLRKADGDQAQVSLVPPKVSDWATAGTYPSPFKTNQHHLSLGANFVRDEETILVDIISHKKRETVTREFLRCGPRENIAYHPDTVKACIVTCGGLCPGLNTVIREIYKTLTELYGVKSVAGVPFGYRGFYSTTSKMIDLDDNTVRFIHKGGGTCLGSSRGGHDTDLIVEAILDYGYNHVYIIGGDGTHRGAIKIFEEIKNRGKKISVVGIPKTIDNDIALIDKSFGFDTAVEEAQRAISSANIEAMCGVNGIGLVKLMGRHSGYIAMYATLASRDVDVCLIPEIHFELEGPCGLFAHITQLFHKKGHCVIAIAEGAGLDLFTAENCEIDASGNPKPPDVGLWLKDQINSHYKRLEMECNLKYIDPTYMIRTVPPNASDSLYCGLLAQSAVHGAMAGYSGFTCGLINTHHVMIPMTEITERGRTKIDVRSRMWGRVIATTGQPALREVSEAERNAKQ